MTSLTYIVGGELAYEKKKPARTKFRALISIRNLSEYAFGTSVTLVTYKNLWQKSVLNTTKFLMDLKRGGLFIVFRKLEGLLELPSVRYEGISDFYRNG